MFSLGVSRRPHGCDLPLVDADGGPGWSFLDELTNKYIAAYGDLARANVRSLEPALALRQMVLAKMQMPPDDVAYAERQRIFQSKDAEVDKEANAARKLIASIIGDTSSPSGNVALARIDSRIEAAVTDIRR